MRVEQLMTKNVRACYADDKLADAANAMWDGDIGCLPVVDCEGRVISVITDRDIAMCAHFSGRPLRHLEVSEAMSKRLVTVHGADDVGFLDDAMRRAQVHRVPVVDEAGLLKGIVTLNDLAHHRHGTRTSSRRSGRFLGTGSSPRDWRSSPTKTGPFPSGRARPSPSPTSSPG